jgi:hypothetical protein
MSLGDLGNGIKVEVDDSLIENKVKRVLKKQYYDRHPEESNI